MTDIEFLHHVRMLCEPKHSYDRVELIFNTPPENRLSIIELMRYSFDFDQATKLLGIINQLNVIPGIPMSIDAVMDSMIKLIGSIEKIKEGLNKC